MHRLLAYAKAAFLDHWHLLVLGGLTCAALIGPMRDVSLPLICAAELIFLGTISTNPRFQRSVDARAGAVDNEKRQQEASERFNKLYYGLDAESQRLFKTLRQRCEIINEVVPRETDDKIGTMEEYQAQGVNKLLWVYLKLLHTRMNLQRFLKSTNEAEFLDMEKSARERLQSLEGDNTDTKEKMRRTLEDTLKTIDTRKANLAKARENFEYVGLELDRISTKVTALSELAVNRQDPGMITSGVDEFAKSVESTEETIGDLRAFTGLTVEDEVAPKIMERRGGEQKRIRT